MQAVYFKSCWQESKVKWIYIYDIRICYVTFHEIIRVKKSFDEFVL